MDDIIEVYLEHYGIKGMKWGVRKALTRGPGHPDQHILSAAKKKKISDLSDEDLQAAVKRWRLLRDYKRQAYKFKNKRPEDMSNEELETESKRGLLITKSIKSNPIKGITGIKKTYSLNKSEIEKRLNRLNLERQFSDFRFQDFKFARALIDAIIKEPMRKGG